MEFVLDAAFIIAVTAFFKEQFGLSGKAALGAAFLVALAVGLAPLVGTMFPAVAPWLDGVVNVIVLFLAAAGGYDAIVAFTRKG